MAQLEPLVSDIEKAGAQLAYIAAEKRNGLFKPAVFLEKHPISFPFLLDEDRSVSKAYGLYHRIGLDALNISRPATVIIDQSTTVRYIYRGHHQLDRAPINVIVERVRDLKGLPGHE